MVKPMLPLGLRKKGFTVVRFGYIKKPSAVNGELNWLAREIILYYFRVLFTLVCPLYNSSSRSIKR